MENDPLTILLITEGEFKSEYKEMIDDLLNQGFTVISHHHSHRGMTEQIFLPEKP